MIVSDLSGDPSLDSPEQLRSRVDAALAEARVLRASMPALPRTTIDSTIDSTIGATIGATSWRLPRPPLSLLAGFFALALLVLVIVFSVSASFWGVLVLPFSLLWLAPALRVFHRPRLLELRDGRLRVRSMLGMRDSKPLTILVDVHEVRLGAAWDVVLVGSAGEREVIETHLVHREDAMRIVDAIRAHAAMHRATYRAQ